MSTYTYRYVEVLKEMIDGSVWTIDKLPCSKEHIGETFSITAFNRPVDVAQYYKATENGWVALNDVEKKWVALKWYSPIGKDVLEAEKHYPESKKHHIELKDENGKSMYFKEKLYWCDNGGYVRDDYISTHGFSESKVAGRGLPKDVSPEIKEDVEEEKYAYDKTWVTLSEWENLFDSAISDFQHKLEKRYAEKDRDEISEMLDTILHTIKNPEYKPPKKKKKNDEDSIYYEDSVEYMFEEEIWKLFQIHSEIETIRFILDEFNGNLRTDGCRVIYYLA